LCIHTGYAQVLEEWSPSGSHPDVTYTIGDGLESATQLNFCCGRLQQSASAFSASNVLNDQVQGRLRAFAACGLVADLFARPRYKASYVTGSQNFTGFRPKEIIA
jgi:hypothetical protein